MGGGDDESRYCYLNPLAVIHPHPVFICLHSFKTAIAYLIMRWKLWTLGKIVKFFNTCLDSLVSNHHGMLLALFCEQTKSLVGLLKSSCWEEFYKTSLQSSSSINIHFLKKKPMPINALCDICLCYFILLEMLAFCGFFFPCFIFQSYVYLIKPEKPRSYSSF